MERRGRAEPNVGELRLRLRKVADEYEWIVSAPLRVHLMLLVVAASMSDRLDRDSSG
jgi:hypothetical protein